MTSLELVEQINLFRKELDGKAELRHDTLLGIIRDEFEEEISLQEILESNYTTERGKTYPMFNLTHAQAKQVLVRESKAVRKAVVRYIEELEKKIAPNSFAYALKLAYEQQLKIEQQTQIIGELQPKASYVDYILKSPDLMTVTQIAKDYGMSGKTLNALLHEARVQYKVSGQWLLYADYHNEGYTKSETHDYKKPDGTVGINILTKWTQKGRLFIHDLLKANGYVPLMERAA